MAHIGASFVSLQLPYLFCNTVKTLESIPVPILKRYPANPNQLRLNVVQVGYFPFIQQATAVVQVLIPEGS